MEWIRGFRIGSWGFLLKFELGKRTIKTAGVSSRLKGTSLHVTMLDFDCAISDARLREELVWLQTMFKLGNFIVLKSSEYGRHAICLDVHTGAEVLEIIRASNCDTMFKNAPLINPKRSWVLRFAEKGSKGPPKYLYTVESKYEGENLQSLAHAKFLEKHDISLKLKQPFGTEEVELQIYYTNKKLK